MTPPFKMDNWGYDYMANIASTINKVILLFKNLIPPPPFLLYVRPAMAQAIYNSIRLILENSAHRPHFLVNYTKLARIHIST